MRAAPSFASFVRLALLAALAAACGGGSAEAGQSRADSYQRSNPREGIGAGGDTGKAPRDMPGSGKGSASPRGK